MKKTVVQYIDSAVFGGTEQIVLKLLNGLDRDKWKCVLFLHPSPGLSDFIKLVEKTDTEIITLPKVNGFWDIPGYIRFIRKIRRVKPSVFHAHLSWGLRCSYGIISSFLARSPATVATQHAYKDYNSRKFSLYQKLISILVDRYTTVSNGVYNSFKKALFFPSRLTVIYNGIDLELYSKNTKSNSSKIVETDNGKTVILTVARLSAIKGHRYLLEAAPKVPDAIFVFVGEGAEKENLKELAVKLGVQDRIIFLGHRNDIPDLVAGSDICVVPSVQDALPLSIIEAMAAEKPVVASDIIGIDEEVVNNETGLLVPKEDPGALAEAINYLISNPEFSKKLGIAGRKRAEEYFSEKVMVEKYSQAYEDLLGKGVTGN